MAQCDEVFGGSTLRRHLLWAPAALLLWGCGMSEVEVAGAEGEEALVAQATEGLSRQEAAAVLRGAHLFLREDFDGNGRTCVTCHSLSTGTLTPADVQARYRRNRRDPLFVALDSDDGSGASYELLRRHATVNVTVPLPPNVRLADDPTARTVTLRRGIPSTLDMPALDPFIMLDGRAPTLQEQARGAIEDHAQATRAPTARELDDVAAFERYALFSSPALQRYARGGPAPGLPRGRTAAEKRGRTFFEGSLSLCGSCHSGPLLDGNTGGEPDPSFRFSTILVSEFNKLNNPVRDYVFTLEDGSEVVVSSADPGVALTTGDPQTVGMFKMTSLRNIRNTPPYFHDNSAATLAEVMDLYVEAFRLSGIEVTPQHAADIVAYMNLL